MKSFFSYKVLFYYLLDLENTLSRCWTDCWSRLRRVCSRAETCRPHCTWPTLADSTQLQREAKKSEWVSLVKKPEREIPLWLTVSWSGLVLCGLVKFTTLSSAYLKSGWIGETGGGRGETGCRPHPFMTRRRPGDDTESVFKLDSFFFFFSSFSGMFHHGSRVHRALFVARCGEVKGGQ